MTSQREPVRGGDRERHVIGPTDDNNYTHSGRNGVQYNGRLVLGILLAEL